MNPFFITIFIQNLDKKLSSKVGKSNQNDETMDGNINRREF